MHRLRWADVDARRVRALATHHWQQRWADLKICLKDLIRSSFLGSLLGALPGIGATTSAFVCYGEARRSAKGDACFGQGDPRGIAAPEAGNNAVAASSLIPLVTLGIPGSVAAAVMYGAFMIQGMIPGPMLMQEHPEIIYGLFVLLLLTDFIGAFVVALPFISVVQNIFKSLNYSLFFPGVRGRQPPDFLAGSGGGTPGDFAGSGSPTLHPDQTT